MADYIDRQAAIDAVHEEFDGCLVWDESGETTANEFERILDYLPSADVQPVRHGYWIDVDDELISGRCSVCGWESHLYEDDVVGMPYCPNCGAKMDEVTQ